MTDSVVDRLQQEFDETVEQVQRFMASETGVRLRQQAAMALITGAPIVAFAASKRLPFVGRLIGSAGIAAVVVKLGEQIRDWEPPTRTA